METTMLTKTKICHLVRDKSIILKNVFFSVSAGRDELVALVQGCYVWLRYYKRFLCDA